MLDQVLLTFKIGHVCPDVTVESIDYHLAVRWSGDLDSAVDETGSWRSAFPGIIVSDVLCLW
jgi:hypothetical protein